MDREPQPQSRRHLLQTGLAATIALGGAVAVTRSAGAQEEATPVASTATRFIAIRSYVLTEGTTFAEAAAVGAAGYFPIISPLPGFVAHYNVDTGDGGFVAISIWETEEAADNSTTIAADFVASNMADLFQGPPVVIKSMDAVYVESCVPGGPPTAATPTT